MDLGDSSDKCERAAVADDVVNSLLIMAAFASCSFFDAPFGPPAVDGGPQASMKVKPGKAGGRERDKIRLSDVASVH